MHEIALRSGREAIRSYIHQLIVRHTLSDTICGGQLHPLFDHSFDDGLWSHSCVPQLCLNSQACYSKKLSQPEKTMPWNCEKMNQADNKKKPFWHECCVGVKTAWLRHLRKWREHGSSDTRGQTHGARPCECGLRALSLPDTRMLQTLPLSLWAVAFISSDLKENHALIHLWRFSIIQVIVV